MSISARHVSAVSRRSLLSGLAGSVGLAAGLSPIHLVQAQDQVPGPAPDQGVQGASPEVVPLFDGLIGRAARMAESDYRAPDANLPNALTDLTYDAFRHIRFRREQALWRGGSPFEVQLLHLGGYLRTPVSVFTVEDGQPVRQAYSPDLFDFTESGVDPSNFGDLGFSGLRLHTPLNRPDVMDDLLVVQGASYFRALCAGCVYGLSARGVAVNTAHPDGEEFPAFTELYVERPGPVAQSIVLYALLDGPSLTGAYRFEVTPGRTTRTAVRARLFARRPVEQLGVGALTSMFDFAPIDRTGVDDFRPRVHDSQGLSMRTAAGDWLWRPLMNPRRLEMNVFSLDSPAGFGLMQRLRAFENYQDMEAQYHLRPSAWVTPRGDWGKGDLVLVEIPTPNETNDNIVAFWKPARPFTPEQPLMLDYDIDWTLDEPPHGYAWCQSSSAGHYGLPGLQVDKDVMRRGRKWVIDFVGGPLCNLPSADAVEVVASADGGRIDPPVHTLNRHTGGVRVFLDSVADNGGPLNLRCNLARGGTPISETWTLQWRPPAAA